MKQFGFYTIKTEFFDKVNDPYLKDNKGETRPHYYCFEDLQTGIYWMIPLSSRIEKYQKIIKKRADTKKSCDILHITKLDNGRNSVFLIQDMFPITPQYIAREYTVAGKHLILTSEREVKEINRKAHKVMSMIKRGVKFTSTQVDVNSILAKLYKN